MPPRVLPVTARRIRVEDVDRAVKAWFDRTVDAHVTSPQGERRKVAVTFASGERWVASADRKGIRDRDGRLILPVIQVRRTGMDPVTNMTALGANVPRLQISRQVSGKTSELANADYGRSLADRRLRGSAVYEVWTVPFPVTMVLEYQVRVQAQYIHQMNEVLEKILSKLEFYDVPSFVVSIDEDDRPAGIPEGQGSSELLPGDHAPYESRKPLDSYYAVGYLEGDLGDGGNLEEFTDQERIVQLSFGFRVPTALLLDPEGERPAAQMETTAFGIDFEGDEEVVLAADRPDLDRLLGPK